MMKKETVLLVNLGTPDDPSRRSVSRYLTQFLNDNRVIDINPVARFLLVNLVIIPFRSLKSSRLYRRIWTKEGSPLLVNSLALQKKLQASLGEAYTVELAMRYQKPSLKDTLARIK